MEKKPARKAAKAATATSTPTEPSKIITPGQAPAYLQGIRPVDPGKLLAQATPEQVQALTYDNFALWAQCSGIEVDGHTFDFDKHRYLLPIYLDQNPEIIWLKAAQLGATVYMLLRLLWYARHKQVKCGMYFPTADGVKTLSKDRLAPLIKSNRDLEENINDDAADTLGLKQMTNIYGKKSSLYMLYLGGQASKDSVPLDIVGFDEVRLVKSADIDQALERISHSSYKVKMFLSTAGLPNCFSGDTRVTVRHKTSGAVLAKSMEELLDCYQEYQALSYNRKGGNRPRWRDITGAVCRGVRPMVKVRLWGGHTIRCTPDHRFATLARNEDDKAPFRWKPISEVERTPTRFGGTVGPSGVLVSTGINEYSGDKWGNKTIMAPLDLLTCEMLGIYVAEGTLTGPGEIQIWQNPNKTLRDVVKSWAALQGLTYRENEDGVFVQASSRPDLVTLFKSCGHLAENKRVPELVLGGSKQQLLCFLDGLISGDGTRHERRTVRDSNREFSVYTSSTRLAEDLCFIGQKVGKPFSKTVREPRTSYIGEQKCVGAHQAHVLTYNPNSFRNRELLPGLGQCAVSSVEEDGEGLAYDLEIDGTPWFTLADSGCLVHNSDIHKRFLYGKQYTWVSKCNCLNGVVLPEVFPDCVVDTGKEVYYRCPKCKVRIVDPQNGQYVAMNPGADASSYAVSQLASKFISPKDVWTSFTQTTNKKEFYNAKLGRPYVDEENQPITNAVLEACVNTDSQWAVLSSDKRLKKNCAMGVDQRGGQNHVVIAKRGEDGKKQIVHVEIIDSASPRYWENGNPVSPFKRLYELMKEYDVQLCVLDSMPNHNEALEFARAFPGRVFLSWYNDGGQDMVRWTDKMKMKEAIRKGSKEIKFKWQVILNRYQTLDYALRMWTEGVVELPHPDSLVQVARNHENGRYEAMPIVREFFTNLRSMVRQMTVIDEDTGKFKMEWIYVGRDPHFTHAWNYCNIALERLRRQVIFTM